MVVCWSVALGDGAAATPSLTTTPFDAAVRPPVSCLFFLPLLPVPPVLLVFAIHPPHRLMSVLPMAYSCSYCHHLFTCFGMLPRHESA